MFCGCDDAEWTAAAASLVECGRGETLFRSAARVMVITTAITPNAGAVIVGKLQAGNFRMFATNYAEDFREGATMCAERHTLITGGCKTNLFRAGSGSSFTKYTRENFICLGMTFLLGISASVMSCEVAQLIDWLWLFCKKAQHSCSP